MPAGPRMTIFHAPPTFGSTSQTGLVKWCGPHQRCRCTGFVQASNTSSRGASKMRVRVTSPSSGLVLVVLADILFSFGFWFLCFCIASLQLAEVIVQPVETLLPELPVVIDPVGH